MAYKKTAPSIPAESGLAQLSTSRRYKGSEIHPKNQVGGKGAKKRKTITHKRLQDMGPERALARCVAITVGEWSTLDDSLTIELWRVFRNHILYGYKETGQAVPPKIADVWNRCKAIIDKEVQS